jgi:4-hydroxythreonine-4-phosphate dehydrogenase
LTLIDCGHRHAFAPGRPSRAAGAASLAYLDAAIALWRAGRIQSLVTAPVTKWAMARVVPRFAGQTEHLARAMGCRRVLMMFVSDRLRVALLTRHLPLRRVPRAITPRLVEAAVRLAAEALRTYFHVPHPRLAVCGLNPHAGEGARDSEERRVMEPVLRALNRQGIACEGPVAADGLFADLRGYDAVVCGYHDQGLIPFKMAARDRGCQLSVGLPIVRTSPDHGSALDIAGQGRANPGSMRYALRLAAQLVGQEASS